MTHNGTMDWVPPRQFLCWRHHHRRLVCPRTFAPRSHFAMKTTALHFLRRRPYVSASAASLGALWGAASLVEWRANRIEEATKCNHDESVESTYYHHHLPREYDAGHISGYWIQRPITTARRFAHILCELGPVACRYIKDFVILPLPASSIALENLQQKHAEELREALTNLGPAFVKGGQQLSIRPDLVPPTVLKELQKLCDSVRPIPDEVALKLVKEELQLSDEDGLESVFADMKMVASASLGQVYRAALVENGHIVAIKVQRPSMRREFSLDLFLLHKLGVFVDTFTSVFTNQSPFHEALYESFSAGSYSELDYENEAKNQKRFQQELRARKCPVVVPDVYDQYTTEKILTSEWIDGEKLADCPKDQIRKLISVGVELFLTQLLDIGAFHSDPHPGNLLVTPDGKLALLDFGLCAEIDEKSRNAMTKAIAHLLVKDFDSLVSQDAKELGFLPEDFDTSELKPILTKILTVGVIEGGSDLKQRKRKLMEISNELNEVFFRYPFSVPPFFALITRGLGLLEGIALTGDPDFDIFRASAPYASRRAVSILGAHSMQQMRRITGNASKY